MAGKNWNDGNAACSDTTYTTEYACETQGTWTASKTLCENTKWDNTNYCVYRPSAAGITGTATSVDAARSACQTTVAATPSNTILHCVECNKVLASFAHHSLNTPLQDFGSSIEIFLVDDNIVENLAFYL